MNRKELVQTLGLVGNALANDMLVPIFTCYGFTGMEVFAYNDIIGVAADCKMEGSFAVGGKTLLGLLEASIAEDVTFTLETEDILVKAGRSNFKLPFFSINDHPFERPSEQWETEIIINDGILYGMRACLLSSSRDNAQPALMGIRLNTGKTTTMYSCDGDVITRFAYKTKGKEGSYMLPNEFCDALTKISQETESTAGKLSLSGEWAMAEMESGYVIYGRLIDMDKPLEYEDMIKKTLNGKASYFDIPEQLKGALIRARVVADKESAKTVMTISGNKLRMVTTATMGVVKDTMVIKSASDVEAHVSAAIVQRSAGLCISMAVFDNCCAFKDQDALFILAGNMNE